MDEIVYDSLKNYFNVLKWTGYKDYNSAYKLLALIAIQDYLYNELTEYFTEDDYKHIESAIVCLFGSTCLINFPNLYRTKGKNKLRMVKK